MAHGGQSPVLNGVDMQEGGLKSYMDHQTPGYIRNEFVKKVYTILSFQLLLTTAIGYYISQQPKPWLSEHFYVYSIALAVTMCTLLGVGCCCAQVAREFPINYAFLAVITVGIGITTGFAASMYTAESVVQAMAATCIVFFSLTAYACLTKTDFTGMRPYLFAALMSMIGFSFVMFLFSMITGVQVGGTVHTLYALAGTVLFSLYIVYDTQMIMGGEHKKHKFSVDDYVFAALNLYLDIINLFLFLLQLMGERR